MIFPKRTTPQSNQSKRSIVMKNAQGQIKPIDKVLKNLRERRKRETSQTALSGQKLIDDFGSGEYKLDEPLLKEGVETDQDTYNKQVVHKQPGTAYLDVRGPRKMSGDLNLNKDLTIDLQQKQPSNNYYASVTNFNS